MVGKVDGPMNFKASTYTVLMSSTGKQLPAAGAKGESPAPGSGSALGLPPPTPEAAGLVPLALPT